MGKKKGTAVVPASETVEGADAPKYRISHTQNGEGVELSFHDAERRDKHAAHLRSIGAQNVEAFDVGDETDEPAE